MPSVPFPWSLAAHHQSFASTWRKTKRLRRRLAPISVKKNNTNFFGLKHTYRLRWPYRGVGHGVSFKSAESKQFFFLKFWRENICWPFSLPPLTAPLSFFSWPEKTTAFCNAIFFLHWFPREMTSLLAGNHRPPRRSVCHDYILIFTWTKWDESSKLPWTKIVQKSKYNKTTHPILSMWIFSHTTSGPPVGKPAAVTIDNEGLELRMHVCAHFPQIFPFSWHFSVRFSCLTPPWMLFLNQSLRLARKRFV